MAENKGFDLASVLKDVSKLDTGANAPAAQQIELIPAELLDQDPNNFYSLEGIEELAANIELLGLQQPILVRPSGNGRYIVISGHRRRAAILLIIDGGSDMFKDGVPCIVDRSEISAALRELQLIFANANSREMTSAEKSRQAERVEMLLYELKKQGVEFPGRMRDHVAEACKMSKTKLARLKVIRGKLDPCFKDDYEKGELSESAAYALAQQPPETQRIIRKCRASGLYGSKYLREYDVKPTAEFWGKVSGQTCKKDKQPCSHAETLAEENYENYSSLCNVYICCDKCSRLATCKASCPKLTAKVQKLKADAKAAKQQEKLAQAEKDAPRIAFINRVWQRFGYAREMAGMDIDKVQKKMGVSWYGDMMDESKTTALECGEGKITTNTKLPFGWGMYASDVEYIVQVANMFGCSTDFLLGLTDELKPSGKGKAAAPPPPLQWQTGTPKENGLYAARFDCGGVIIRNIVEYSPHLQSFSFPHGASIDAECIGWIKLPEED